MTLLGWLGGGLWIIPLLTLGGAAVFGYLGYKSSKSGSTVQNRDGSITESKENVPFYKTGFGVFSILLVIATIVILIMMYSDR